MSRLPPRIAPLAALALGLQGCGLGGPPTPAPWVAGVYEYLGTLPGTGLVSGSIEIGAEGPEAVTSSLGACRIPPEDRFRPWNRSRTFVCATETTVRVALGRRGEPPVTGTVSDEKTTVRRYWVETDCARFETTPTGEQVCVQWRQEERTERVTTGSTVPFTLVASNSAGGR